MLEMSCLGIRYEPESQKSLSLCAPVGCIWTPASYVTASLLFFSSTLPTPHKINILALDLENLRYVLRHPRFAV